ncbi:MULTISPECIES: Tat pathway signal protein [Arthrobacter]|uniref:Tat pathway signal protein n=2 Tax=Arthrobacter TaxID=1663 RepID=A0ABU9KMJ7_9MICC|nr:Tat pathway signal protein [Arthrobacter sp. YJM1]MDP5227950.1 Tat pathway signal protein [Arthrobacter sp. YJM1]
MPAEDQPAVPHPPGHDGGTRTPGDGAGRRGEGTAPAPPWQPPAPPLDPELVSQGADAVANGGVFPGRRESFQDELNRTQDKDLAAAAAQQRKRRTRRTVVISLGVTALLAGTIAAVVSSQDDGSDYAEVCTDQSTQLRVDDSNCDSSAGRGSHVYGWYFFARGSMIPSVGSSVRGLSGGTSTLPSGTTAAKGFSSSGGSFSKGTTSRGGFGGSSDGGKSSGG